MAKKTTQSTSNLKEGDRVRILVDTPEGQAIEGTVRVVQDKPGMKVGVEFDHLVKNANSLEGLLPEGKYDAETNTGYGKGWWTLEENVEKL